LGIASKTEKGDRGGLKKRRSISQQWGHEAKKGIKTGPTTPQGEIMRETKREKGKSKRITNIPIPVTVRGRRRKRISHFRKK